MADNILENMFSAKFKKGTSICVFDVLQNLIFRRDVLTIK